MAQFAFIPPASLPGLTAQLRQAEGLLGSPTPLLKAFGVVVLKEIDAVFRAGGKPPWKALTPWTLAGKRRGKGSKGSTAQPLQGLRDTFEMQVGERDVTVFTRHPAAGFQHYGTKGPYIIRAKAGKALALPALSGGPFSLSGLTKNTAGKFIADPRQSVARFARTRGKKAAARALFNPRAVFSPYKKVAFFAQVTHPGLVPRPVFPTEEQILPVLIDAGRLFLDNALAKVVASGGVLIR